ncbi:putative bifunctional diguanylate cyclase/phosphodiesterase [Rhodovulum euryhalinum]|uniref:PAS domain S-box-containing protein/diguanylate cyclase (GGDEF)-like protein n=1 Tax=Rhodovulum euryhalinum TaxID=35805 RepID=A0A4R2KK15_9RHOB|nr:GGDEF and EAL domain-containing protein [Rhodovulum euryhalinum]TCO72787.1 PAS domain S-box-containing protein/diguanylate cyclase (GGDEF)-like protein [Rhodovulum euryhalinum]
MPRRSGIGRILRHWPSLVACALAAVLLIAAWQVESSARKLAAVSQERLLDSERSVAVDVSRMHRRFRDAAKGLARSREIENYFVNLDLGMSRLYGLNANLKFIETLLRYHVATTGDGADVAFRHIALFGADGELLAASGPAEVWAGEREGAPIYAPGIDVARGTQRTSVNVVIKGKLRGTLVAIADLKGLSRPIRPRSSEDRDLRFILFASGDYVQDGAGKQVENVDLLSLVSQLPDERPSIVTTLPRDGPFGNRISIVVDVPGAPFTLLTLKPRTEAFAGLYKDNTGLFLFALAAVILVATLVVSRMGLRAERLQTVYEMSRKHHATLQRKNAELSDEISRRHIIELDLKSKSEELDRTNESLRIAATAFESQEGMAVLDMSGRILQVNTALARLAGCNPDNLLGLLFSEIVDDEENESVELSRALREGHPWKGDVCVCAGMGVGASRWLTLSPVLGDEGRATNMIGTFYDVSDRKQAERQIKKLAFYDQLTGLPNRPLLTDRTVQAMRANAVSGEFGALLFIDLDQFKRLNDTLGHDVGDKLLKVVAERISLQISEDATVARFGGDEFVVLLPGLKTDADRDAVFLAEEMADRILGIFEEPFQLDGYAHSCSASIGIAFFSTPLESFDEVLKRADIAMYEAKGAGRNLVRFFDPEMQRVVAEEASLEADLRTAVDHGEFELHFQPQVTASGQVIGAEVLLRWPHKVRGLVSPAEFVPIAEKTGLIVPIGTWVLRRAVGILADWARNDALAMMKLSINVSAAQLHGAGFVETVLGAIDASGARPECLKLEITESLLVRNIGDAIQKMSALQSRGILFSLDDFGTGYSSLSYLKLLPLDQLKIDQSFVRDLPEDGNDAAIAEMVVALGRTLGLNVIAEGVETIGQKEFLQEIGCDQYQGYLFGKPMPLDQFEAFARANAHSATHGPQDGFASVSPRQGTG